jgi:prepilin-type N-terminal cleavage/methylation domain-containing protein
MKRNNVSEKKDTFAFWHRPLAVHLSVKQKGFTLIEVMVAAVILFAAIATVSMIYRGAFLSSETANNHISINAILPSLLTVIRNDIQKRGNYNEVILSGRANAWGVNYQWKASLLEKKSAPPYYNIDAGKMISPPKKYKLWLVNLTLQQNAINKQYQFNEYSWTND